MSSSISRLLRSRCFHGHAVWSKDKPLFREEKSPNQWHRNSAGSSSAKPRKKDSYSTKFDIKNPKLAMKKIVEEKSPNQWYRNSAGSSSAKPRKKDSYSTKFDIKNPKLATKKIVDVPEKEKVNIRLKKQPRRTHVKIDEVAAEKMVLYKDSELHA